MQIVAAQATADWAGLTLSGKVAKLFCVAISFGRSETQRQARKKYSIIRDVVLKFPTLHFHLNLAMSVYPYDQYVELDGISLRIRTGEFRIYIYHFHIGGGGGPIGADRFSPQRAILRSE